MNPLTRTSRRRLLIGLPLASLGLAGGLAYGTGAELVPGYVSG